MAEEQPMQRRRESLSALMDGDAQALPGGCAAWREDGDARAHWHTYHLIGDVLRSDELARRPEADEAFLRALRTRLAGEPVVLAPSSTVAAVAPPRRRWLAPAAAAAGFFVVAGVLVVTRGMLPADDAAPQLASAAVVERVVRAAPAEQPLLGVDSTLIRDARLDRYLQAHKQYGGSSALGLPGGVLQRASTVAPEQAQR